MSWLRERGGRVASWTALGAVLMLACSTDETPTGIRSIGATSSLVGCASTDSAPALGAEGEIFGSFYVDGERICDPQNIALRHIGGSRPSPFDSALVANHAYPLMWEFWGVSPDHYPGPCADHDSETGHASGSGDEAHCATPGVQYMFASIRRGGDFGSDQIPVDWPLAVSTGIVDTRDNGAVVLGELTPSTSGKAVGDLVINVDLGSSTYSETAVLRVDTTSSPTTANFSPVGTPSGTASTTFRFATYESTTNWSPINDGGKGMGERGTYLTRLYKKEGAGAWSAITGYYGHEGDRQLRSHQFAGPVSCETSRTYTVGVEVLRPDEGPSSSGWGVPSTDSLAQVTITIYCEESSPPPYLAGVTVSPSVDTVAVAATIGLTASGYDQYNAAYATSFGWTSRTPAVATVNASTGVVTGVSAGSSWIVASSGGFTDSAYVIVEPVSSYLNSVVVTPSTPSVNVGLTTNLTATGYDQFSAVFSATFSWLSRSTGVATVNSSGVVTGVSSGTSWIVASSGGLSDSTRVTVTAGPEVLSFIMTCVDTLANGHHYNALTGFWTISGDATGIAWETNVTSSSTPPTWGSGTITTATSGTSGGLSLWRNDVSGPNYLYFWVKYYPNGSWFPLGGSVQAIDVSDPNLCVT